MRRSTVASGLTILSFVSLMIHTPSRGATDYVGAYGLNEGAGTTAGDASATLNSGTLAGATWTTAGKFDKALVFNGSSSYVELSKLDTYDSLTQGTISAWVKQNATGGFQPWFSADSGNCVHPFELAMNAGTFVVFGAASGCTGTFEATVSVPTPTAWHHLAYVVTATGNQFYVDGVLKAATYRRGSATSKFFFASAAVAATHYNIGRSYANNSETFNGLIDELRIYGRALSQAEIQADMNSPVGGGGLPQDTTAPTVSLSAPTNGATVSGSSVAVSASASDNVGVAGVQFRLDGAALGVEDTSSPYSVTWNTTSASNGSHTLTAVARDAAGNTTPSSVVSITVSNNVDTVAPTVSVSTPTNGATVSGASVTLSASASDNVGVAGVQFSVDGLNVGAEDTAAPYSVVWNSTSVANGSHTVRAVARDAAGNAAPAQIAVTVSNGGSGTTLTINGAQQLQTMAGFGVNINSLSWFNTGESKPAIDMLADQMGATLWRVVFDMEDWEATNDDANPSTYNWTYYNSIYGGAKFQNLWGTLAYLNQKGFSSGIALSFMGRAPTWMGGSASSILPPRMSGQK